MHWRLKALRRAGGPWFQECEGSPWTVDTILCYEVWTTLQEISYVENITEFIAPQARGDQASINHKSGTSPMMKLPNA